MGESWAANAREPPALKTSVTRMGEIRNRKGGGRKRNGWRGWRDPHSGKKSEILLTLRGKSEGVGNEGTKRLRTDTHTPPVPKPPAASEAVSSQKGCERSCQRRARLQASR